MKTFEQLKRSEERFVGLETQRGSVPQKLKRAMKIAEGLQSYILHISITRQSINWR